MLRQRLNSVRRLPRGFDKNRLTLLIVGGAGGVGSIAIQLARQLTGLTIIATASRPETRAWCESLGAHHVVDHSAPLEPQLEALSIGSPHVILVLAATGRHLPELARILAPQGHLGVIEDSAGFDFGVLRNKSASIHFEYMFSLAAFQTPDIAQQHAILNEIAHLVDAGIVHTTSTRIVDPILAAPLRQAHALVESGTTIGKLVLEGFG